MLNSNTLNFHPKGQFLSFLSVIVYVQKVISVYIVFSPISPSIVSKTFFRLCVARLHQAMYKINSAVKSNQSINQSKYGD